MSYIVWLLLVPFSLMADSAEKTAAPVAPISPKASSPEKSATPETPIAPLITSEKELPLYYLLAPGQSQDELRLLTPKAQFLINDLPEIQDMDLKNIVAAKLVAAFQYRKGTFVAESSGLALDALNGLPGPFYPWFQRQMGNQGIVNITRALGDDRAEIIFVVGYAKSPKELSFFQGRLKGRIVSLRGNQIDDWDSIFQPEGNTQTLAEMDPVSRSAIDPRRYALEKLRAFLEKP